MVDALWVKRKAYLESLEAGWGDDGDSTNWSPINHGAIQVTEDVLRFCVANEKVRPGIFPIDNGGVQLEWYVETEPFPNIISIEILPEIVFELFQLHNVNYIIDDPKDSPPFHQDTSSYTELCDFILTRVPVDQ
jgi:hypothetical protein